ncbi:kinase-like domain-containing protein [Rhizophagus irregularis DAOM 181602=DAOM 197198]|nr:kinase-like domain-containing protein [Rhizophagus irregularis DAOM 181602=DAOM 197198]
MSDNIKMQDIENKNEWNNWIEEVIDKEHIKYYEYKEFNNFGTGNFGKVYRTNWKNLEKCFAVKSFFNLDNITIKEIIRELKNQREVDYHDNIIHCYGITKFESTEYHDNNNYKLVMEYANNACAVSCLHNERIVHRDLHSGLRETVVPDTPENYVKIYTGCWDGEPDNRPNIHQVVDWLKEMITKTDAIANNLQSLDKQEFNKASLSINGLESQEELSQLIQNFNKMITKEIDPMIVLSKQENISAEEDHILAHYFVGDCYLHGTGTTKDEKLVFEYFEKVANKNFARGQLGIGYYCYENGIGINKDIKKAIYWYERAANNGNIMAMCNLSLCYLNGNGVDKDDNKTFELSKQSAEGGYSSGMTMLGYCYEKENELINSFAIQ